MTRRVYVSALLALFVAGCGTEARITQPEQAAIRQPLTVSNAIGTDSVTGATIETNQDDYVPGELVHVVGSGWAAGETVHLVMTEDPDTHPDVSQDVVADATGSFSIHFYDVVQEDLGVTFTLTATGETSGSVAVAVFTDAAAQNVQFRASGLPAGTSVSVTYSGTGNGGNPQSGTSSFAAPGPSANIGTQAGSSFSYTFPPSITVGATTYNLSSSTPTSPFTTSGGSPTPPDLVTGVYVAASSNTPPTVDAGGPYSGFEGSAVGLAGASASDADNDPLKYKWSYAPGASVDPGATCSFSDDTALNPTVNCTDDGSYTLTLTVEDGVNSPVSDDATLTLSNVAPDVSITTPSAGEVFPLSQVSSLLNVSASFSDDGTNDTHTCSIDWGNGTSSTVTVSETLGAGTCTKLASPNPYTEAGVYSIVVTITDDDHDPINNVDGIGKDTVMIVVYDPSAGFVTGGGWINVGANSYAADPTLTGKGTFGFVSRYKKGATVPDGNTEFVFHAASFNFHSASYDWLVVNQAGTNAQFKGSGTVNGVAGYTFMLWATDGSPDTFRIKIWHMDGPTEVVDFDNGFDQSLGGGSIQIQTGSKK